MRAQVLSPGRWAAAAAVACALALTAAAPAVAGQIVYACGAYDLCVIDDDGTNGRLLYLSPSTQTGLEDPHVSPDGQTVIAALGPSVRAWRRGVASTVIGYPGGADFSTLAAPEFSDDTTFLFAYDSDWRSLAFDDVRRGTLGSVAGRGFALEVCDDNGATADDPRDPAPNPVYDEFVYAGCPEQVAIADVDDRLMYVAGMAEQALDRSDGRFADPSWSPDGEQLLYVEEPTGGSSSPSRIHVIDFRTKGGWTLFSPPDTLYPEPAVTSPRFMDDDGDGAGDRVVFGYNGAFQDDELNGLWTLPAACESCTLDDAEQLSVGGRSPAWTAVPVAGRETDPNPHPTPTPTPPPGANQPPGSGSQPLVVDRRPPGVTLTARKRQRLAKAVVVRVKATTEDMRVTATGRVTVRAGGGRARSKRYALERVAGRRVRNRTGATLRLGLSRSAERAVRRALRRRHRVTAAVTVQATDTAGNKATASVVVKIRR